MTYDRTQHGSIQWLMVAIGVAQLIAAAGLLAWRIGDGALWIVLAVVGATLVVLSRAFAELRIHEEDDALLVAFGPLPLFRRRIAWSRIHSAAPATLTWRHGIGIHRIPRRGWVWNVDSGAAVELQLESGFLRLGTDDTAGLLACVQRRIAPR